MEQYAITGGVPKYLEFFEDGEGLFWQVESVILSKNGFLYEEPNFLLKDEIQKDFIQKFVAFAYEDICKAIFADRCRQQAVAFTSSRIGAYWLNDLDSATEIDVMAVDHQHKQVFAGECKYHTKPVDAPVYFALSEKVRASAEIQKAFKGYQTIYGVFPKSGFTQRLFTSGQRKSGGILDFWHENAII